MLSKHVSQEYVKSSFKKLPVKGEEIQKMDLPFLIELQPFANETKITNLEAPPFVNYGKDDLSNCFQCISYLSGHAKISQKLDAWKCGVCGSMNRLPKWHQQTIQKDPILREGVVDISTTSKFHLSMPKTAVFAFVFDLRNCAIGNKEVRTIVANTLRGIVEDLQDRNKWKKPKLAFLTFTQNELQSWVFPKNSNRPKMVVLSDPEKCFTSNRNHLASSTKCTKAINSFINMIESGRLSPRINSTRQTLNKSTTEGNEQPLNRIGFFQVMEQVKSILSLYGGKIFTFLGPHPFSKRWVDQEITKKDQMKEKKEQESIKEFHWLQQKVDPEEEKLEQDHFSKSLRKAAGLFAKKHFAITLFLFGNQNSQNLKVLENFVRLTGGDMHLYPPITNQNRFLSNLVTDIKTAFDNKTVSQVSVSSRTPSGIYLSKIWGNGFVGELDKRFKSGSASINDSYLLQFKFSDSILISPIFIQLIFTYTNSFGERRQRIFTLKYLVTENILEIMNTVNVNVLFNYYLKMGIKILRINNSQPIKQKMISVCVSILQKYYSLKSIGQLSGLTTTKTRTELILPESLSTLPLICFAYIKNEIFLKKQRQENKKDLGIYIKNNIYNQFYFGNKNSTITTALLYPHLYSLHNIEFLQNSENNILPRLSLTQQNIQNNGIYLIFNGLDMFLLIQKLADNGLINELFGTETPNKGIYSNYSLPINKNSYNIKVREFIQYQNSVFMKKMRLNLIFEEQDQISPILRNWLIEDKSEQESSYQDFTKILFRKLDNL
ncbi:sec24-related protein [Anaeramoeba flamelloides]|uniref:Sec24-related protein n=1 Tax=Anaeramoeba flamelloides TaxID=1746091 RepID=A0ABQ8YIR8_9EUKA|nr:sec24-related protein [Anaeramoeba flamelloides]